MLLSAVLTVPLLATAAFAAKLTVSVGSSQLLNNPSTLPPSTHAVLLGPPGVRYDVPLRRDNSFSFPDLDAASYLLTVYSRDHFFQPLRVDVSTAEDGSRNAKIEAWQTFRGNEWSNKGPHFGEGLNELSIQVRPAMQKNFYQERGGFSIISFLKSPMILMALVSGAMIFGMPYLMDNMDAETKAEFEEMQKKGAITGQNGAATQIQNFDLASWMAGKSSGSGGGGSDKNK